MRPSADEKAVVVDWPCGVRQMMSLVSLSLLHLRRIDEGISGIAGKWHDQYR